MLKVVIDQAESELMDEMFKKANTALGGILNIERQTLPFGDYWLKAEGEPRFVFSFKEFNDFQHSFWSGHLNEEINAMYSLGNEDDIRALLIAPNEHRRTEQTVHQWVSAHWRKRNFLIPTFKFAGREKAVEFMIDCAMTGATIRTLERKLIKPEESDTVAGVYCWYGVGKTTAEALATKYPVPMQLFTAMIFDREYGEEQKRKFGSKKKWIESRWFHGILGEKKAGDIERLILEGVNIPRTKRGAKTEE
jgi:hypothetical protein